MPDCAVPPRAPPFVEPAGAARCFASSKARTGAFDRARRGRRRWRDADGDPAYRNAAWRKGPRDASDKRRPIVEFASRAVTRLLDRECAPGLRRAMTAEATAQARPAAARPQMPMYEQIQARKCEHSPATRPIRASPLGGRPDAVEKRREAADLGWESARHIPTECLLRALAARLRQFGEDGAFWMIAHRFACSGSRCTPRSVEEIVTDRARAADVRRRRRSPSRRRRRSGFISTRRGPARNPKRPS